MSTAHVIVAVITIAMNTYAAIADFTRAKFVVANSTELGLPHSWVLPLGLLKLAGALGLVAGLARFESLGIAAAAGLVAFFVGAMAIHIKASVYHNIVYPGAYLASASATLVLAING
ncbi:DoxX family protein [Kibdelosporangium philippinense]|uniref:DoxX family protein n=1 Tax=Kibdelosporangium philippinense TaxID=211113 RepID=A0ABS8ZIZ8_9PSEU|nr:DoxX family protein [Kibdelosporangium philippinense]MCE7005802.1 DoxX family protein [Kibdelosporangium philippinense]